MSELREEVPGDAGYEVERFAKLGKKLKAFAAAVTKCETCVSNGGCPSANGFPCHYQPKPSPVLGYRICDDCTIKDCHGRDNKYVSNECSSYQAKSPVLGGCNACRYDTDFMNCHAPQVRASNFLREKGCWERVGTSPVLGETVMTDEEIYNILDCDSECDYQYQNATLTTVDVHPLLKAQDSHTRKRLIEQGWKSPKEIAGIVLKLKQLGDNPDFTTWRELKRVTASLEANDAK